MERLKKLLLSQTIKDTLISFLGLGFAAAVGFAATVILARTLGPEQFGILSAISALITIVCSMGDLGIASALINFIPKLKEKRSVLISTSLSFEILVGIFIFILFSLFAIYNTSVIPGSVRGQLLIAGFLSVNYLFLGFAQGIFTAERRFWGYSFSQIIDAGVKIVIIYTLLSISRLSIETALLANVISTLLTLIIIFGKEFLKTKLSIDNGIFLKIVTFAKWIAVTRIFSVFISRIDVILLNLLSSSFQAGIFAAANRITLLFSLIVSSLSAVINPRFSGFNNGGMVTSYIKKLIGLISLASLLMLISALFAKPIIDTVFGDKFVSAIPVFQSLTVAMIPFMFSLAVTPALIYTFNENHFVAQITAFQVILMVILEIFLIPKLGAFAPAIALGLTNIVATVLMGIKLLHLLRKDPPRLSIS